jgi:hypothetical protein
MLEFEITDGAAVAVRSGKRDLTDINYQIRSAYPTEDYLRYEKDTLREWLRGELGVLNAGKTN